MSKTKRGRGRPIGTGLNDAPILNKIADIILANPALRPTTAIRRCLDNPGPSVIRRLQVKWKAGASDYLDQARKRRTSASAPAPAHRVSDDHMPHTARRIMEAQRKMLEALGNPALGSVQEMMNTPAMLASEEAARCIRESLSLRAICAMQNSPTMRASQELQDSPTMRAIREMQDSPTMRVIREMQNSPATRALGEASAKIAEFQRLLPI